MVLLIVLSNYFLIIFCVEAVTSIPHSLAVIAECHPLHSAIDT